MLAMQTGAPTNPTSHIDILILGGGPAGLALGCELQRRGLAFLILEAGATVGESWRRMPSAMKMASPWKANQLAGRPENFRAPNHQASRQEFLDYLRLHALQNNLPVHTGAVVSSVEKTAAGCFCAHTAGGDFTSRLFVSATGCFSNPFVPAIPGAVASRVRQLHVADYCDPENLRTVLGKSTGMVLIVGQRLSAGQAMVELVDAGFEVALSHRSPIEYGAGPLAWWFLFRIFPWLERLKLQIQGPSAPPNDVKMQGGRARELIQGGAVKTYPAIRAFGPDHLVFEDGVVLKPDLVLYATGFRPVLKHLAPLALAMNERGDSPALRDLESVSTPGLFFLGLDGGRNFQSRFIRGIRNDAMFLADELAKRLALAPVASVRAATRAQTK